MSLESNLVAINNCGGIYKVYEQAWYMYHHSLQNHGKPCKLSYIHVHGHI